MESNRGQILHQHHLPLPCSSKEKFTWLQYVAWWSFRALCFNSAVSHSWTQLFFTWVWHTGPSSIQSSHADWFTFTALSFQNAFCTPARVLVKLLQPHSSVTDMRELIISSVIATSQSQLGDSLVISSVINVPLARQSAATASLMTQSGSRDSLFINKPDSWSKSCKFETQQKRQENFLLQHQ